MKYTKLNQWLWRWHVIAGLVSLPFVITLAITGGIYLFKNKVEAPIINSRQQVEVGHNKLSYEQQWQIAKKSLPKLPTGMVLPVKKELATEFVSGKFSHKKSVFINPYTGEVTGKFTPQDTWMYTIRKLHGELLGGKVGTKIVELIASWMVVLILTGIYVFWPVREWGWKGFFKIRTQLGNRILFRDIHAVGGFWISVLLLITLAGGFPWTDIFGGNFKKLQQLTKTGFPLTWHGVGVKSVPSASMISLDEMVAIAKQEKLSGKVTIDFPKTPKGVYSISNVTLPLTQIKKIHFDTYTGKKIMTLGWQDIGILMQARLWLMAFHQGQMGTWNFILMLLIALFLTVISIAGLLSFKGRSWGIPEAPHNFKVGLAMVLLIVILAIIFPLFGISLLFIFLGTYTFKRLNT